MAAELMQAAQRMRAQAYAPYSRFTVGAAVLDASGAITGGCNVENASYGLAICAERVALTGAVAAGRRAPVALAVASESGSAPCGACRQVMLELGPDMKVYLGAADGSVTETTVRALLPLGFGPSDLADAPAA